MTPIGLGLEVMSRQPRGWQTLDKAGTEDVPQVIPSSSLDVSINFVHQTWGTSSVPALSSVCQPLGCLGINSRPSPIGVITIELWSESCMGQRRRCRFVCLPGQMSSSNGLGLLTALFVPESRTLGQQCNQGLTTGKVGDLFVAGPVMRPSNGQWRVGH
ncbi:unnamed protein product [Protopolystoma xenopodis]|uniref:Uncharacterized protein n=1 Tax=Protopolystoma xenopodis TaxID=117903 RepID=A0A3S5B1H0_9PLAT|nr:unnamed protein product [Protopolystoma xenopodis]